VFETNLNNKGRTSLNVTVEPNNYKRCPENIGSGSGSSVELTRYKRGAKCYFGITRKKEDKKR